MRQAKRDLILPRSHQRSHFLEKLTRIYLLGKISSCGAFLNPIRTGDKILSSLRQIEIMVTFKVAAAALLTMSVASA